MATARIRCGQLHRHARRCVAAGIAAANGCIQYAEGHAVTDQQQIECLIGQVVALRAALVAVISTSPNREEILATLHAQMPGALARLEHDGYPIAASCFEATIERIAEWARAPTHPLDVTRGRT
jgi:hypothetical protein